MFLNIILIIKSLSVIDNKLLRLAQDYDARYFMALCLIHFLPDILYKAPRL